MPDSFEDRIFNHLRAAYPDLDEGFIRRHPKDLMEMLAASGQPVDPIDKEARSIPDYLPEDIPSGIAPPQPTPDLESKSGTNIAMRDLKQECMGLLTLYMQRVLAGEIKALCIQAIRADGGHEVLFTLPCDFMAFYGFMTYAASVYMQGSMSTGEGDEQSTH